MIYLIHIVVEILSENNGSSNDEQVQVSYIWSSVHNLLCEAKEQTTRLLEVLVWDYTQPYMTVSYLMVVLHIENICM